MLRVMGNPSDGGPWENGDPDLREPARTWDSSLRAFVTGPWLGPVLLFLVWFPLFLASLLIDFLVMKGLAGPHFGVGLAMGWGTAVSVPGTVVAIASMLFHGVRGIYKLLMFRNRFDR